MEKIQYAMKSILGPLYLIASSDGLEGVFFTQQAIKLVNTLELSKPADKLILTAVKQLEEYFAGTRKRFDLKLHVSGTDFQKKVWEELYKIPYGNTVSYKDIAQHIKNPKAIRAVGSANGKNPLCIIIPCHRVIAADGSIGGYSGGINIKKQLLKNEKVLF